MKITNPIVAMVIMICAIGFFIPSSLAGWESPKNVTQYVNSTVYQLNLNNTNETNVWFNSTKSGDINQYWINEVLDLTGLGLGYLPMLSAKTTSPAGNYGIITNGLWIGGVDTGDMILRFVNLTTLNIGDLIYHSGTSRFELTNSLDISGDLIVSRALNVTNLITNILNVTGTLYIGEIIIQGANIIFPASSSGTIEIMFGTNTIFGLVQNPIDYFSDSIIGDIAYRNQNGRIIIGTTGTNSTLQIGDKELNITGNLTVKGDVTAWNFLGYSVNATTYYGLPVDSDWLLSNIYIYNNSGTITMNESKLNSTILSTASIYNASGVYLSLEGGTLTGNLTANKSIMGKNITLTGGLSTGGNNKSIATDIVVHTLTANDVLYYSIQAPPSWNKATYRNIISITASIYDNSGSGESVTQLAGGTTQITYQSGVLWIYWDATVPAAEGDNVTIKIDYLK